MPVTDLSPIPEASHGSTDQAPVRPFHDSIRLLRCEAGKVEVRLDCTPRCDYRHTVPAPTIREPGLAAVFGGANALLVRRRTRGMIPRPGRNEANREGQSAGLRQYRLAARLQIAIAYRPIRDQGTENDAEHQVRGDPRPLRICG